MRPFLFLLLIIGCKPSVKTDAPVKDSVEIITAPKANTTFAPVADSVVINSSEEKIMMKAVPVVLLKGLKFSLNIPVDYHLSIAAEGLKRLRFLAMSPDGRLFATDMHDRGDNRRGRVLIFEDWNDSLKRFEKITTYLDSLRNPNQVAFYKNFIYVAETDKLSRFSYNPGDSLPSGSYEVVTRFPDYGLGYKYGGWHLTRSLAFHDNKLYVSVGSSCNACIETEEIRASIMEMDPDGGNLQFFARGTRNSVGLKWIGNKLWATSMGRDLIGPDKPEDVFEEIEKDGFYGWPWYFQYRGEIYEDEQFGDSARKPWVKKPPIAFCGFKAHSAPLGFEYLKDFKDSALKNAVLVCLHGSTSVWRERGNAVVKVGRGNSYSNVVSGFLAGKTEPQRFGRPCDILMKDDRSLFITDDLNGVLYYLWK